MTTYNTNLAAEFYVLSMLHRLGADASLTLGNKKSVDIFIADTNARIITIDVKGLAGAFDWPADNIRLPAQRNHFIALLSFEGKIADPMQIPRVWILPANELPPLMKKYKTRTVVSRHLVRENGGKYLNAWHQLVPIAAA